MKKLLLLPLMLLSLVSCNDDEPQAFGPNQTIVGFSKTKDEKTFLTDQATGVVQYPINLIGFADETLPGDVIVNWSVNTDLSTATEGVEFEVNGSQTVTIPAGSTGSFLNFDVYPMTMNPTDPKIVVIDLTTVPSNNAIIGEQYKRVFIKLQGICNSQLQGNYLNSTFRLSNGATYVFTDEVWTKDDGTDATYTANHVGQYYGSTQAPGSAGTAALAPPVALFHFTNICDKISVTQPQNLADAYTNIVTQSPAQYDASTIDPDTGVVTIQYSIWFTNNTIERKFIGTYTPQ